MTGPGGQTLGYGVFQDTGHQTYWGNTATTEKTGTSYLPVTFYGLITALQYPTPGTYTDTLATATATFPVSVTVLSGCAVTATNLAFGNYVATAALTSTSIITVTCTNTTPYNVGLSAGASGSVTARAMTGPGGHTLGYGLYQDTGHGTNWGVTIGTNTEAGIGTGSAQTLTVYGQIPKGEFAVAGAYTDTITATVTY
jgi:spore coat protein U-like protein